MTLGEGLWAVPLRLQMHIKAQPQVCKSWSHDIGHNFIFDIIATPFLILGSLTKSFLKFLAYCKVTANLVKILLVTWKIITWRTTTYQLFFCPKVQHRGFSSKTVRHHFQSIMWYDSTSLEILENLLGVRELSVCCLEASARSLLLVLHALRFGTSLWYCRC